MNRIATVATLVIAGLALAACGSTATAGGSTAKASPSPGLRVRNGAQGELVQMNGTSLILNATTGDATVVYDASTTFQKTSTGTFQDITANRCIVATGAKDPSGNITAATVRLSDKLNGACAFGQGPGGGFGGARTTPVPGASPRPNPGNLAFTGGEVTKVAGTTVTVQPPNGAAQTVIVPTTVRVSKSSLAKASDLALHQCLSATGPKDASGKVTARAISIVPAGPSGCFTGGGAGGGFGGFGRGAGGGGGGGGGAPGD